MAGTRGTAQARRRAGPRGPDRHGSGGRRAGPGRAARLRPRARRYAGCQGRDPPPRPHRSGGPAGRAARAARQPPRTAGTAGRPRGRRGSRRPVAARARGAPGRDAAARRGRAGGRRHSQRGRRTVNPRDLLVLLDTRPASAGRLEAALTLASTFEAHLTALCLVGEPSVPLVELPPDALYRGRLEAEADCVLADAAARAGRAGVAVETRRETAAIDRLPDRLVRHARHADLAILGQPEPDDR